MVRCCPKSAVLLAALLFAIGFLPVSATALDKTWIGDSGQWDVSANWSPSGQPQAGDTIWLTQTDGTDRTVTYYNATNPGDQLGSLYMDSTGTGTMTLNLPYDYTFNVQSEEIGRYGMAVVTQSAGTNNANGFMISLGYWAGSNGTYSMTGGTLTTTGNLHVGVNGTGTLEVRNGAQVFDHFGYIGYNSAGMGTVTIDGAGSKWTNTGWMFAGYNGTGTLNITNGGEVTTPSAWMGARTGSSGTITVSGAGSKLTNSQEMYVGAYSTGALYIQNGGLVTDTQGLVGFAPGSTGTVVVDGAGSLWSNSQYVSISGSAGNDGGPGSVTVQNGGQVTMPGVLQIYRQGTLNIYSGGTVSAGSLDNTRTGTINWTGGTLNITGSSGFTLGSPGPLGSSVTLDAGKTLSVTNNLSISSGATLTLSGGSVLAGTFSKSGAFNWTSGILGITGSSGLTIGSTGPLGSSVTVDGGKTLSVTNNLDIASGATLTLNDGTVLAGTFSKSGAFNWTSGTLGITGPSGLTIGSTGPLGSSVTLDAGKTLNVATTTTLAAGSALTLVGGSLTTTTLTDTGSAAVNVSSGGHLSSSSAYVGSSSGSTSNVTVSDTGSVWSSSDSLYVGGSSTGAGGTASLTVKNGGSLTVAGTLKLWKADSTVAVNAGTLTAGALSGTTGTIRITDPAGSAALTVGSDASDTFSGLIRDDTGPGALVKVGSGTQTLGGANTYTGGTTLAAGKLVLSNPSGSALGTGDVVLNGGTLASSSIGSLTGDVSAGSGAHVISPGDHGSVGVLRTGSLYLTSNTTLDFSDITSTTVLDQILSTGSLNFSGGGAAAITLSVSLNAGTYKLIDFTSAGTALAGNFSLPGAPPNYSLQIDGTNFDMNLIVAMDNWIGASGATWTSTGSWLSGTIPNGQGAVANFSGNGGSIAKVDGTITIGSLNFSGSTSYDIQPGTGAPNLAFSSTAGNAIINLSSDAVSQTVSAPASLSSDLTVTSNANGLTMSGGISGSGRNVTLASGLLVLQGANTYSGNTNVTGGTLRMGAVNAAAPGSTVVLSADATLDLNSNSQVIGGLSGTGGAVTSAGAATLTIDQAGNTTFGGQLSGALTITKAGAGTLTLANTAAANNYTGATNISAGTLLLGVANALPSASSVTVQGGGTLNIGAYSTSAGSVALIDGTITGTTGVLTGASYDVRKGTLGTILGGSGSLTKTTPDIVTLAAANTFTGGTMVSEGTLRLGLNSALPSDNNVTVQGGTLDIGTYTSGAGTVTLVDGTIIGTTGVLTALSFDVRKGTISAKLSGSLTKTTADTVTLAAATLTGSATVSAGTLDVGTYNSSAGAVTLIDGTITGTTGVLTGASYDVRKGTLSAKLGGSGALTKTTTDTVTLSGVNTYTGATTVSAGTLLLGVANALPSGSSVTVQGGGTLDVGASNSSAGAVTLIDGTITGTTGVLTASSFDARKGTISAKLSGSLMKTTADTLTLASATLTGIATVSAGTLDVGASNSSAGAVTLIDGSVTGTTGVFSASSLEVRKGAVSAILGGTGTLTKTTSDTVTLTGASTYTGATTLSGGILRATSGTGLSAASNLVFNGGMLEGIGTTTFIRSMGITGANTVRWTGSGGFSASSGKMTVAIGGTGSPTSLTWGSGNFVPLGSALIFGSTTADNQTEFKNIINLAAGTRTVTVNDNPESSADFATISSTISNGTLFKDGPGTLKLSGTNTFTGGLTVGGGTLTVASAGVLAAGNKITVQGGGTFDIGSYSPSAASVSLIDGTITGTTGTLLGSSYDVRKGTIIAKLGGSLGSLTKTTADTVTLMAANTFALGTTVSGGTLCLGKNNALPSGKIVTVQGGSTLDIGAYSSNAGAVTLIDGTISGTTGVLSGLSFAVRKGAVSAKLGGTGGLTKITADTVTLSAANTFSGVTTVSAGTLLVENTTGSGTGTGPVTVGAATLGGTGFINGPVTLTGDSTLTSTGVLTIYNTLTVQGLANQLAAGTVNTTGDVTINPGAEFIINGTLGGGTGSLIVRGTLMGKGTINKDCVIDAGGVLSPGSPSTIQGMAQMVVGGGPQTLAFEIGAAGPNYASPSSSVNDVIRLTDASTPFADAAGGAAVLGADTVIDVYFLDNNPAMGGYKAEFFAATDFTDAVAGATYEYWRLDPRGSRYHNGNFYSPLEASLVDWSVVPETAPFDGQVANGFITEFTVVPEPATLALLALGGATLLARRKRRK